MSASKRFGSRDSLDAELEHFAMLKRLRDSRRGGVMTKREHHREPTSTRAAALPAAHDLLPHGLYVDPLELCTRIARELDQTQWNADTLVRITRYLLEAGFDIREPEVGRGR